MAFRNVAICAGVHTATGGRIPVRCHSATRSAVHTTALGRRAGGSSVRLRQFDRATFGLGRDLLDVGARRALGIYSAERSIVDVVRLRHREGSDMAWEALRHWLAQPGRSPAQLIEIARKLPKAEPALRHALEVLL
jgi:hypothetical protein